MNKGGGWLDPEDDPFITYMVGQCWIRMDSVKTASGRSRLTYKTMLAVYHAYWVVFITMNHAKEGAMRVKVAGILAGYGAMGVKVPGPPAAKDLKTSS